jgi:hypothetical protein
MAYTTVEARQKVLSDLAIATAQIAVSLTALGEAYEQLDDHAADTLEEQLFRPVQAAYGRAKRTHSEFAARSGLPVQSLEQPPPVPHPQSPQALIDRAVFAAGEAGQTIADLQDSMLPVEVGDPELRAGLSAVRESLSTLPNRARELVRTVGR